MAITLLSTDQPASPNYSIGELVYVLSSTNINQTEFTFVIDITVGGETFRYRKQPNPSMRGIIDVQRIINDNLQYEIGALGVTSSASSEAQSKSFSIVFSEEFLVGEALVISNPVSAQALVVIKGFRESDTGTLNSGIDVTGVLSDVPQTGMQIHRDDTPVIAFYDTTTNVIDYVPVTAGKTRDDIRDDALFTSLMQIGGGVFSPQIGRVGFTGSANRDVDADITASLGSALWSSPILGSAVLHNNEPIGLALSSGDTVLFYEDANNYLIAEIDQIRHTTEHIRFNFVAANSDALGAYSTGDTFDVYQLADTVFDWENPGGGATQIINGVNFNFSFYDDRSDLGEVRLWWFNRRGGLDWFTLDQEGTKSTAVDKTSTEASRITHGFTNSSNREPQNSNVFKSSVNTYRIDFEENFSKNSRWLTQELADYLSGAFDSPAVYVQEGDLFRPIEITNSAYDTMTTLREVELFQYQVEYNYKNSKRNI